MDSLLAVLLVVRSRPGPQLVYRYPPQAQRHASRQSTRQHDDSDSDSDGEINGIASLRPSHAAKPSQESAQTTVDINETAQPESTDFLGFSEDSLEKLLAPGPWNDRKKFEICLDGITFVGHPIHAHEDGRWTRRTTPAPHGLDHAALVVDDSYGDYTNFGITVTEPASPVRAARDSTLIPESLYSQLGTSFATSVNSGSSTSTTVGEQLSMFNVVFAFDATAEGEDSERAVTGTYKHVIRKLSKALHYCQKQSNYVSIETRRLLSLYARAKQDRMTSALLQQQIQETSELAWALKELFDSISAGNVAGIRLNGQAISLHVPPQPSLDGDEVELSSSAGLMLLEDKGTLLRELSHPEASPLAHFIREHTPTKSLQKLAARLGMSVDEAVYLAGHLVKWRKARVIQSLHPRNSYIVHPDAPIARLPDFVNDYARKFPGLPSLPQVLKFLSGKPIRYGMLMPSRDHRLPYMEILAYLVRHEFVAQLKMYGWLRRIPRRDRTVEGVRPEQEEVVNQNRMPLSVASLLSPQLRAVDDDSASVSSDRTAIPLNRPQRNATPVPGSKAQQAKSHLDGNVGEGEADPWNIILDPTEPSSDDAEYLTNIQEAIEDEELVEHLPSLLRYFTGEEALESIAAREGLKRSLVERWMDLLQREELITTFRHL